MLLRDSLPGITRSRGVSPGSCRRLPSQHTTPSCPPAWEASAGSDELPPPCVDAGMARHGRPKGHSLHTALELPQSIEINTSVPSSPSITGLWGLDQTTSAPAATGSGFSGGSRLTLPYNAPTHSTLTRYLLSRRGRGCDRKRISPSSFPSEAPELTTRSKNELPCILLALHTLRAPHRAAAWW